MGLTRILLASALVLSATSCELITGDERRDEEIDLRLAERRWNDAGIMDYQIVVQQLCFCGYTRPVRLTVQFGNVVSRVDAETGEPVPPAGNSVRDIPRLFDLVRDAIDKDAHSLTVSYDLTYGFPTQINIDYIGNAVDDELDVKTSEFQPAR